jgi:hypothetical protein
MTPAAVVGTPGLFVQLELEDRAAGRRLRPVQDRTDRIGPRDILLVTCLGSEPAFLPAFVAHYRDLGVGHFLMVDSGAGPGFADWAAAQPDVSVWRGAAEAAHLATGWRNDLLRRHGCGHWCVTVEPDEFLVYSYMGMRDLAALAQFLADDWRICMHAVVVDAYSDGPPAEAAPEAGGDPFALCPYFDRDGYIQSEGWGNAILVQGGPHLRMHFSKWPAEAPALNRIPLIRWQRHFHYRAGMREAYPRRLNRAHAPGQVSLSAALFRFNHVAGLQQDTGPAEASAYAPGISTRYRGPEQLVELGLMSPGRWF